MRHAKKDEARTLFFVDPTYDDTKTITLEVRNAAGDLDASFVTQASTEPNLQGVYETTTEWTPASTGTYFLNWTDGTTTWPQEMLVSVAPVGDESVDLPRYYQRTGSGPGLTCTLEIYNDDQALVDTLAMTEVVAGVYRGTVLYAIEEEGLYLFRWTEDGSTAAIETVYVGTRRGVRDCRIFVRDTFPSEPAAVTYCDVLISLTDGTAVFQEQTDDVGKAEFTLDEGVAYVVSLRKDGYVFAKNNHAFTPDDPDDNLEGRRINDLHIYTDLFPADFDSAQQLPSSSLCLFSADFLSPDGLPVPGVRVLIDASDTPEAVTVGSTEWTLLSGQLVLTSDQSGHVETYLVRGAEVEVAVVGTPIRRTFTVPDAASTTLMSALGSGDDPFIIATPNLPTAVRRSP